MIHVKNKKVTILGAGRSGIAAARLLSEQGAFPFITDINRSLLETDLPEKLESLNIPFEFGLHSERAFDADFAIISPGISPTTPIVTSIAARNIPITSEIELAFWFAKAPTIAITGSNGKSTTTTLTAHLLNESGVPSLACGNLGNAFSEAVRKAISENYHPLYVVECSSFQLENISLFMPDVAVLLNITPDHLDRYTNFDDYAWAKAQIFHNQSLDHRAVINMDDAKSVQYGKCKASTVPISLTPQSDQVALYRDGSFHFIHHDVWYEVPESEIILPGDHNKYNIMAAVSAVLPFVSNGEGIVKGLKNFKGIPHRLEFIREYNGLQFYNDSKATNLDSVRVALRSFKQPIHLILGGKDKKGNFQSIRPDLDRYVKEIYTIGEAAATIENQLPGYPITSSSTLDQAISNALTKSEPGQIILLSPGCASFDQYKNFEARGDHFREIVNNL